MSIQSKKDPFIVALDVDSFAEAKQFVKKIKKEISLYKVGSVLFTSAGPDVVKMIRDEGGKVFLDLKFHDIPHTVAKACEAAARLGVFMLTVHASGGQEMLEAAANSLHSLKSSVKIVGVTVLTSQTEDSSVASRVLQLASLCQGSRLDGVVCSPKEISAVRSQCGKDFVIVTPGIRPLGSIVDDQKRTATPAQAIKNGADYLVIGRPVLEVKDPVAMIRSLRTTM